MRALRAVTLRPIPLRQLVLVGLTILPAGLAQAQSVTKYTYDVHGQVVGVSRGESVTTYTYDDAQNRVAVSSGLNMDPGPPPSGAPAAIIVLPLSASRVLRLDGAGGFAMAARQLSSGAIDAAVQARATSLYRVSASNVVVADADSQSRQTEGEIRVARLESLAVAQSELKTTLVGDTEPMAARGAPDLQSRAAGLSWNGQAEPVDTLEPPPPAPFNVDVLGQRLSSLRGL